MELRVGFLRMWRSRIFEDVEERGTREGGYFFGKQLHYKLELRTMRTLSHRIRVVIVMNFIN